MKGNQPSLRAQLAALPWRAVADADRGTCRGHGRREIRTLKILSVSTGIDFPNAAQAIQIRRRRRRLDQPKRFTLDTFIGYPWEGTPSQGHPQVSSIAPPKRPG